MNFMFSMPTLVRFGCGVSGQIGAALYDAGFRRIFFVYDSGVRAAGLVDPVAEALKTAGLQYQEYGEVLADTLDYQVREAVELAADFASDAIVALGGGSVMDLAKGVNILLSNPSPIHAYEGMNKAGSPAGPLYVVPTTAGSGSEVSGVAVVTDVKAKRKMALCGRYIAPTVALADPELALSLPEALTASTGTAALGRALESCLSVSSSPFTEPLALEATRLIMGSLRKAFADGKDIGARGDMLLGSMLAASGFAAVPGLAHAMALALGACCGVAYGLGNALMLSHVMEFNIPAVSPEKMRLLARAAGLASHGKSPEALGRELADALAALAKDLGIPRIRELGVPKDLLPALAEAAMREPSARSSPRAPSVAELIALYEKAW